MLFYSVHNAVTIQCCIEKAYEDKPNSGNDVVLRLSAYPFYSRLLNFCSSTKHTKKHSTKITITGKHFGENKKPAVLRL